MKQLIIFEGCDCTGKTTIISKLIENLKFFGYNPFVFHLMGPTKFQKFNFSNDEKSLIQLSKFDDELSLFNEVIQENEKNIIILDRSHFGEYVWTKYWNREGKYTQYLFSNEFMNKHKEIFNNCVYLNIYLSDIDQLEHRIASSNEDLEIFTQNNKTIKKNINDVYKMFDEVKTIVKKYNIDIIDFDNSFDKSNINNLINKII